MIYTCLGINNYEKFRTTFRDRFRDTIYIDLSNKSLTTIVGDVDILISHHSSCSIFLGYLEPGWMLEPTHQTILRKLFRKFNVGFCCEFVDSIPFSWKTDTEILYVSDPKNE
jgi:hypothetical protein